MAACSQGASTAAMSAWLCLVAIRSLRISIMTLARAVAGAVQVKRVGDAVLRPVRVVQIHTVLRELLRNGHHRGGKARILSVKNADFRRPLPAMINRREAVDRRDCGVAGCAAKYLFKSAREGDVDLFDAFGTGFIGEAGITRHRENFADGRHRVFGFRRAIAVIDQPRHTSGNQRRVQRPAEGVGDAECARIPGRVAFSCCFVQAK